MTARIRSFGCRLNLAEGEAIAAMLGAAGDTTTQVVNTCAVTREAEADGRRAVRAAVAGGSQVVVTGCAATIDPAAWALPGVTRIVPNAGKALPASWGAPALPASLARTRAFIEAQSGCDHACTFCIIPKGRGASISVPIETVVARVRSAVAEGAKEVVLSGVDLTSWCCGDARLGDLVKCVLHSVPELPRLRLSSIDVAEIDTALLRALAEEQRLMPHLHLSLQSGDDLILKRMKRRHSRRDAGRFCAEARRLRPDIVFGADLIAGFPTESDAAFDNTLGMIEEFGLTFLHVFPYSPRPGTPASRMPQVPMALARERAARLRQAGQIAHRRAADGEVGGTVQFLAEAKGGRTQKFFRLALRGPQLPSGSLLQVRVTAASSDGSLLGEAA